MSLLWSEVGPLFFELEERADSEQRLARGGLLRRDRGLPELSPAVAPARDLVGRFLSFFDCITAEERVIDAMRVGLDVTLEAAEHRADGVARVLLLVLE